MISLIHPSRGRSLKSKINMERWLNRATTPVEWILSIDKSDNYHQYLSDYSNLLNRNGRIIVNDNDNVVQATNHAAAVSSGDILVYVSDDFDCPDNWDTLILKEMDLHTPMILKVDDCLQKFSTNILTIPIMNREMYKKLGYFWHPSYSSMFVDEDLFWTAKKTNSIKNCEHIKFKHLHYSIGACSNDMTYIRSSKNWEQGKRVFQHRKENNFI